MLKLLPLGKKMLIVGNIHLKKFKKNKLNHSFRRSKCIMKSFSRVKIKDLEHNVTAHLEHDRPDIAVMHIRINNVSYKYLDIVASILAENIIVIGNTFIDYGVEEVVRYSIFVKESIRLSSLIRKVHDKLCDLCFINKFHFILNECYH